MSSEERQQMMDFIVRTLANLSVKMEDHEVAHRNFNERLDRFAILSEQRSAKIDAQFEKLGEEIRDLKVVCADLADASRNTVRRLERLDGQAR